MAIPMAPIQPLPSRELSPPARVPSDARKDRSQFRQQEAKLNPRMGNARKMPARISFGISFRISLWLMLSCLFPACARSQSPAPEAVEIPVRVAVVQTGVNERVLTTKVYRTTVSMTEAGGAFSLVGEDLLFNMPAQLTSDSFVLYVGFDPQAVTPQAKPSRRK